MCCSRHKSHRAKQAKHANTAYLFTLFDRDKLVVDAKINAFEHIAKGAPPKLGANDILLIEDVADTGVAVAHTKRGSRRAWCAWCSWRHGNVRHMTDNKHWAVERARERRQRKSLWVKDMLGW